MLNSSECNSAWNICFTSVPACVQSVFYFDWEQQLISLYTQKLRYIWQVTQYLTALKKKKKIKINVLKKPQDRSFRQLFLEISDFNDNVLQYPVIQDKDVKGQFIKKFIYNFHKAHVLKILNP